MNAQLRRRLFIGLAIAGVAIAALIVILIPHRTALPPIAGMVRQTEIRIAPEITGRLASIEVRAGQTVRKGDLLAVLSNPELAASLGEAKAAARSAKAQRDDVYSGVRAEQVAILAQSVQTAEANLELVETRHARHFHGRAARRASRAVARACVLDRKSTRLNSSHSGESRMPSSA